MAQVWKVHNESLQREEALKLLSPKLAADREFVERFRREAQTAAKLQHPSIATIYAVSPPEETQLYFTMEYIDGVDLVELLKQRGGRLSEQEAISWLKQVAAGLDYAHSKGVTHRDIKPANILVTSEGVVRLIDFGIARKAESSLGAPRLTQTGMIVGTPAYMFTEQARGDSYVTPASDQYSLACVAFELMVGQPPFPETPETTQFQVLMHHIQTPPPDPIFFGISPSAAAAIRRALSKVPVQRFASCQEFVGAMQTATPISIANASPEGQYSSLGSGEKRGSNYAPLLAIVALAGLTLIGYSILRPGTAVQPTLSQPDQLAERSLPKNMLATKPNESTPMQVVGDLRQDNQPENHQSEIITPKFQDRKDRRRVRQGSGEMVLVPGGTYATGEGQQVSVRSIWMDATPVTVGQYRAFCVATSRAMPKVPAWGWNEDHPIVWVSWRDAQAYAGWAGGRLPTTAEFEYAARDGGKPIEYPWGNNFDFNQLWCSRANEDAGRTAAVHRGDRSYANSLGLSDMAGNVWQWCSDSDGHGNYFMKGGSWGNDSASVFRCSKRLWDAPANRGPFLGFRLCVDA